MSRSSNQLPNLDKLFKDDDDQDFTPLAGSNLAAIFGTPQKLGNASTSTKQPGQKKTNSGRSTPQKIPSANKTEVIMAKVVHAYKLKNRQYSMIGKLGVALTGNISSRVYQIILYVSKQEHVSTVTLTPEFSWTICENNYVTYYDGSNENWSLVFEDETSCVEFAREVGVSRYNSRQTKTDDSVFYQNLTVESAANVAKEDDEIHLKCLFSTNLIQPLKFDSLSSQNMNVHISPYDNWERSLINGSKGLRRLLILPSSKQISLGPGFPKEREIVMEIEIIDIIRNENRSVPVNKPPISSGKASILSRMAKMGQSMLPKVDTSTPTDSEDTEEEVHVTSPRRFKPEAAASHSSKQSKVSQESSQITASPKNVLFTSSMVPANVTLPHRPVLPSPVYANPWPVTPMQQQYVTMDGQYYPIQQAPITQSIPVGIDPNLNVFLSETRTQNTEIRMGMAKLSDNVQKLLDKFHILEVQSASSPMNLRRSVQYAAGESTLGEKQFTGGEMNAPNGSNSSGIPITLSDENRSKDSERIKRLETELNEARELLEKNNVERATRDIEKQSWTHEKFDLVQRIDHLKKSVAVLDESLSRVSEKNISSEKSSSKAMETTPSIHQKTGDIKRLMNNTYRMLLAKFTDEDSYTGDYIKETLADTIRTITFSVLNDLEPTESSDENLENDGETINAANDVHTTNPLPTIPVAQEEPPPVPPMDEDTEVPDDY